MRGETLGVKLLSYLFFGDLGIRYLKSLIEPLIESIIDLKSDRPLVSFSPLSLKLTDMLVE
jgi:hypothetical protein